MWQDPRGPIRTIVNIKGPTVEDGTVSVTLSCGHTARPNPIYAYHDGEEYRCFACRTEDTGTVEYARSAAGARTTERP